ncbi:HSP20-like chaperone [Apiosordaria backusii]|uniref:HSP20-like chaperone n=1 Tax=Apiosordaria backusii TaxID=314023 RepID=A0AA40A434_9PEZI|nr:HSP20-like chaperone [Apiosordaria backusii]
MHVDELMLTIDQLWLRLCRLFTSDEVVTANPKFILSSPRPHCAREQEHQTANMTESIVSHKKVLRGNSVFNLPCSQGSMHSSCTFNKQIVTRLRPKAPKLSTTRRFAHSLTGPKISSRTQPKMSLWYPRISHANSPAPGFSSLFRMLDDFDKYAHELGGRHTDISTNLSSFSPKFDVTEHEKDYTLQGELPGVSPENVAIEFTDPQTMVVRGRTERKHEEGDPSLRLGGSESSKKIEGPKGKDSEVKTKDAKDTSKESKESKDKSGPKYWLSERSFGEFSRVFNFPHNIDQDKVKAKFNQGILEIVVPKAEKTGARKIEIQG